MQKRSIPGAGAAPAAGVTGAEALNDAQRAAVEHGEGPVLVIAGAGSGKTRTLTHRVARLVAEGTPPAAILLLTFTRKASEEMLKRAARLLDHRCARVAGGTFHSFANLKLRQHAPRLNLSPDFAILDRTDSEDLIGLLRQEIAAASKDRLLPRKSTLADIFSRSVNKAASIEDLIYSEYGHLADQLEPIGTLFEAYRRRKREHQLLDYDDLLVFLRTLLQESPELRRRISAAYRFVMVDEYQDTNAIQAEILGLLTDAHRNIMVVGDDSQSIYAFRGANFRNIIEFPKQFPGTRIIGLEENYRSTQPILELTNVIIARAREKYSKTLFTRRAGGERPQLIETADENSQSRFVVERLHALIRSGVPLARIAVLFRAGYHSFDLELELAREDIPFVKIGGFKFAEAAHVKDVLAHLRVLVNPYDRVSWHRVLLLLEKVGPRSAERIYAAIAGEGGGGVRGLAGLRVKNPAVERLKELYARIRPAEQRPVEMAATVIDYYLPILKRSFDDHPKRARDLEQLLGVIERYAALASFLADMALEPPNVSIDNRLAAEETEDRLVLSTIHSAKGREWHSVFVIWALEGRFPSLHAMSNETELEEELRLMYVAATRARNSLFFTYPRQVYDRSLGIVLDRPSRFLDMIPEDILEKRTIW
jgi:DNA helicase-2/ATP-dependent DNA helicase PcrA